jgi:hypothetical protein
MDENETYDPTWRDDAELDALLLVAKITGLAELDGALDIRTGHRAILAQDPPTEMQTLASDAKCATRRYGINKRRAYQPSNASQPNNPS